ncbi:MAG: DUF1295 domain-containing protein, partial [Pseudomonadota bacterium]
MNVHGAAVGLLSLAGVIMLALLAPGSWVMLAAAAALMVVMWGVSLPIRNAGIIDIVWGPVFLLMALVGVSQLDRTWDATTVALVAMVGAWAIRLGLHLGVRNIGKPEDFRYQLFRKQAGDAFAIRSLFTIFLLQAVLAWVVAAPIAGFLVAEPNGTLGALQWVGISLFVFGFVFETVADWQLTRFKGSPDNKGQVLDSGLWGLSRHPNYFGEAVLWWGIYLFTVGLGGELFIVGPVLITWMLMKVSGVTMLEKGLEKRRPAYREYVENTPTFFPRWPAAKR